MFPLIMCSGLLLGQADSQTLPSADKAAESAGAVVPEATSDSEKTREQLIQELQALRARLSAVEVQIAAPPGPQADNGDRKDTDPAKQAEAADKPENGNGACNGNGKKSDDRPFDCLKDDHHRGFFGRIAKAYYDDFFPDPNKPDEEAPEQPRRALPAPLASPPFPSAEWQGYPLIGVPISEVDSPLSKALYGCGTCGQWLKDNHIQAYGWINASGNWSTAKNSNTPDSYWIVPNRFELDQLVFRIEKQVDTVQTDHISVGFRSSLLFGIDYRYMTAGGWWPADRELLVHNQLYGADFTEQYIDVYFPGVAQGMVVRIGRYIACPDIETQFAPDNYMGTHSILFTFDTYTQTGIWVTVMLNKQWTIQAGINAGDDMAPWYKGAQPCGVFGVRWVSACGNDSIYAVLNQINDARFQRFTLEGQPAGHDNFNYPVVTWQHKVNESYHFKTEGYFMWERNDVLSGTPSIGPTHPFGGGGGIGPDIKSPSFAYGVVNYQMFKFSKKGFITVRNEWWKDEQGMRSDFPGVYTSHALGLTYNFNPLLQIRPEIGYYRNWTNPAFDLGTKNGITIYGLDMTLRF